MNKIIFAAKNPNSNQFGAINTLTYYQGMSLRFVKWFSDRYSLSLCYNTSNRTRANGVIVVLNSSLDWIMWTFLFDLNVVSHTKRRIEMNLSCAVSFLSWMKLVSKASKACRVLFWNILCIITPYIIKVVKLCQIVTHGRRLIAILVWSTRRPSSRLQIGWRTNGKTQT